MEYLRPEMFTIDGIMQSLKDIVMQKETLEFKFNNLKKQVDTIKSAYYKDLLIYERKKEQNKNLIPDLNVLTQLKDLERTDDYKRIKASMDDLKIQIKQIDDLIESKKNKLSKMFKFHSVDLKNYTLMFEKYLNTKNKLHFEELMATIFEKEFQDRRLYILVKLQRNYEIFNILFEKVPSLYKTVFSYILQEQVNLDSIEDEENFEKYGFKSAFEHMIFLENKLNDYLRNN